MKISEYIQIVKPEYEYYKLTPNYSIRNNSSHKIAKSIISLYKNVFQSIRIEEKKVVKMFGKEFLMGTKFKIDAKSKVSYFIYIEKKKVEFYFIIPKQHASVIKERINDVWGTLTIKQVDKLPTFNKNASMNKMVLEKEDAFSLHTDRRDNNLLTSNLNIVNVLDENDKVGILYNFIPVSQHSWRSTFTNSIDKFKDGKPVDRNKGTLSYLFKLTLSALSNTVDLLGNALSSDKKGENDALGGILRGLNRNDDVSHSTNLKGNSQVLDTQIVLFSESDKKLNELNNMKSITQSFESISDDNRLVPKRMPKLKHDFDYNKLRFSNVDSNKLSPSESQNLLSIAGREILEDYNFIEKIETQETEVPEELQNGTICIGTNTHKGTKQKAYLSNDVEFKNLTQMLIGPTRAGKSTLIGNIANDALNNDECVIMFDFIKNCDLSEEVAELFTKDKVLNIECNDFNNIQGLGYNEVGYDEDTFKQYDNAKRQTTQLLTLVNSINTDGSTLTAKMERYLSSAALVVFISGGSIKDVFDVLQNENKRLSFINKVKPDQMENLEEYIFSLRTLDEIDKEGELVGTKLNLVIGIIDRLNKLKANTFMELMLKKGSENNIDLSKEIQKNQLICIKMPEDMFSTDGERDVYSTYWITKLWLALQMRARNIKDRSDHVKVNLVIDEIYQVENTEKFLTEKLSRLAKFTVKPIISCHYINQLKYMRSELRSANTSYMLISGCDKENYNEFKEELYPYNMEDLLKLKRFHSLNLIKTSDGYGKFITKLPTPIDSLKQKENKLRQG